MYAFWDKAYDSWSIDDYFAFFPTMNHFCTNLFLLTNRFFDKSNHGLTNQRFNQPPFFSQTNTAQKRSCQPPVLLSSVGSKKNRWLTTPLFPKPTLRKRGVVNHRFFLEPTLLKRVFFWVLLQTSHDYNSIHAFRKQS